MQNILVPTDFSPIAENALDYAVELAIQYKSNLFLYHIYDFNKKIHYNEDYPDDEQPYVQKIKDQMYDTVLRIKEKISNHDIEIQSFVTESSILGLFTNKVKKHQIDLIVMGSKGASGMRQVVFGSNAANAIEVAKAPLMVIPPNLSFKKLNKIVLAADYRPISAQTLLPLQNLASTFNADVTILNVYTDEDNRVIQENKVAIDGIKINYHEVPFNQSINASINQFIAKQNFDVLCMIRRKKSFFNRIFKKSITRTQVYNSQIPIMVLPDALN